MKTKFKFFIIFLLSFILFIAPFVYAENNDIMPISEDSNSITNNNTNNQTQNYKSQDLYLFENSVTIDYVVDGNAFIFANDVTISSQIAGDVFVFARNITIDENSAISGNLFAVADSIEIQGIVYDIYSMSNSLTINNGYVYRDLKSITNDLNLYGTIGRNAFVTASSISFANSDNSLSGMIYGDFNYTSKTETQIPEDVVYGSVNYTPLKIDTSIDLSTYIYSLGNFLIIVIVLWAIGLWFKNQFKKSDISAKNKTLWIVLSGILGFILTPLVSLVLLFIPITNSISVLLLSIYFIILAMSKAIFTIGLNEYTCKKLKINNNIGTFGILIISSIIVWALCLIPYNIGSTINFIAIILGFGIFITSICCNKNLPKTTVENTKNNKENNLVEKAQKNIEEDAQKKAKNNESDK